MRIFDKSLKMKNARFVPPQNKATGVMVTNVAALEEGGSWSKR